MTEQQVKTHEPNSESNPIALRHLAKNEMYIMDQISEFDGRNPGLNDGEFLFDADQQGFIAAIFNSEALGTISIANYPDNLSFIGLHIVMPHLKDYGIKEKLLSVALRIAGDRNIELNSKEEDVKMYEEAGFKPAYKITTCEGICSGEYKLPENVKSPFSYPFDALYDYYKKVFPYERKKFISFWLNQPKSLLLGNFIDDECKGLGLFKPCKKGYRLSPLLSDNIDGAKDILIGLSSHFAAGTPYYLDLPEKNLDGINMADELGLKKSGEVIRMYKGNEHEISLNKCYSFVNLEVG